MTVSVSKPAINIREELCSLKPVVGAKGSELLRAETNDDVYNAIGPTVAYRNKIINGDASIWQRGISHTISSGQFSLDRFVMYFAGGTAASVSRQFDNEVGTYASVGVPNLDCQFTQFIENNDNWIYNKPITVSFLIRSSNINSAYVRLYNQGTSTTMGSVKYNIGSTWTRVVATFPASTSWSVGNMVRIYFMTGQNNTGSIEITQMQAEVGTVATPFERRPYEVELAMCQRYWQSSYSVGVAPGTSYGGNCYKGENPLIWSSAIGGWANCPDKINFAVEMRTAPSIAFYGCNTGASGKAGGTYCASSTDGLTLYGSNSTSRYVSLYAGGSGLAGPSEGNWACNWVANAEVV